MRLSLAETDTPLLANGRSSPILLRVAHVFTLVETGRRAGPPFRRDPSAGRDGNSHCRLWMMEGGSHLSNGMATAVAARSPPLPNVRKSDDGGLGSAAAGRCLDGEGGGRSEPAGNTTVGGDALPQRLRYGCGVGGASGLLLAARPRHVTRGAGGGATETTEFGSSRRDWLLLRWGSARDLQLVHGSLNMASIRSHR